MRITLTLLICLSGFLASAQKEKVRTTVEDYFELVEDKKISEALDFVHPELIEMLGKDFYVNQFNQIFNAPGMEISQDSFRIVSISEGFDFEEETFVQVPYAYNMTVVVDMSDDTEGLLASVLLGTYQRKHGKDNVTFTKPGTYKIKIAKDLIAIKSTKYEGWKLIEYEESMRMFLGKIVPDQVKTHFKY